MSNNGRRKSLFPSQSSIPSDATFDFVSNSVNYKIPQADFLASLGVTGSIIQDGDPTSAPVLDTQGAVNNIRNLKDGAGVKASVNANNGITLDHNFTVDSTGAPLMSGITDESPVIKSIVAGSGIAVSQVNDTVVIADSGVVASTKTVLINALADFPDPISNVINLLADTNYLLANDIDLGINRLVLLDGTSVQGSGALTILLTYTGTGDLFTWVNANIGINNLKLYAPNGRVWNGTNGEEVTRLVDLSIIECDKIGRYESTGGASVRQTFVVCALAKTDGIEFVGSFAAFIHSGGLMTINNGVLYKLGTATFPFFTLDTISASVGAGAVALSGLTNSGNITPGGTGRVLSGVLLGSGTIMTGVSADDIGWLFFHNNGFPDTRTDALLSMQNNATATAISAASTDGSNSELIAGTWTVETISRMTGTTGGRVTLDLYEGGRFPFTASVSLEPASGSNVSMSAYIAINGVIEAGSKRSASASAGSPSSITIPWQYSFVLGDYVEVFVENNDTSADILVSSAVLRVN